MEALWEAGATVQAYDPEAMDEARRLYPVEISDGRLRLAEDENDALNHVIASSSAPSGGRSERPTSTKCGNGSCTRSSSTAATSTIRSAWSARASPTSGSDLGSFRSRRWSARPASDADPRHRRGRLHRLFVAERLLADGHAVLGIDDLNDYYAPSLKRDRLARLEGREGFEFRRSRCRIGRAMRGAVRCGAVRPGDPPRRPGRGALLARESGGLRRQQPGRLPDDPRGLPASPGPAPRLRLDQLGLRRQHPAAVLGAPRRRSPGQPLRRDQAGERADGAHLQPSLPACRRPACASSRSTGPGAGRTWPRCSSPRRSWPASRSSSSTTARCAATSPTSTDIAEGVVRVMDVIPEPDPDWDSDCPDPATSNAPFRIYNIGNSEPVELDHFIDGAGDDARQDGDPRESAAAAGRCPLDLGRHQRPRSRHRLPPADQHRRRPRPIRRLVPGLLPRVSQAGT